MSDLIKLGETDIELIDGDRGNNYPSKNDFFEKEFCLFLDANNISNNGFDFSSTHFITKEKDEKLKKGKLQKNDIVMMTRGSVGNVALYDESVPFNNIRINSGMLIIRCHNDYNSLFLYYMLKSEFIRKQIDDIMSGSVQKQLPVSVLQNLLLFPQNEKSEIIETLSIIDKKIKNNNVINADLEEMAKTIYDYWFLQFEFPDEEGKPYKSSGGKMVWNKELKREIPEGWSVCELKDAISLEKGISYTKKNIESGEGVPMINLASIDVHRNYKPNELKYFQGTYNVNKEVHCGDMLIACTDLTRNADIIGSPILVPNDNDKYLYSMDLAKLTVTGNQINPLYLYMTLRTDFYHNYIKGFASGTNVLHLNTEGIVWFRVCIPSRSVQEKFATFVDQCHNKSCEIIKENQELTSLRDFLLPLLMNGQVSFKE